MASETERRPKVAVVADLLSARTGLDFTGARGRWLRSFVSAACVQDQTWLRPLLDGDDDAFEELCDAATVQESYFFREPGTLRVVRERVLPDLRLRTGNVDVWSAGCAGGEETYTLAMLLAEAGLRDRSSVLGTDLARTAVDQARRGLFTAWSLRGMDAAARSRYFRQSGRRFRVDPRCHARVAFEQHNLLDDAPPNAATFDLVMCRNVLIYLTADAIQYAAALLARSLRPGGWLVTGIADPVLHVDGLEPVPNALGTVYRRVAEALPAAAAPTSAPPRSTRPKTPPRPAATRAGSAERTGRTGGPSGRRAEIGPGSRAEEAPATATEGWRERAEHALLLGEPREAARLAREALATLAERPAAHCLLVRALEADGQLAEALRAAEHGIAQCPLSAELHAVHAAALLEADRPGDAEAAAKKALYLDPAVPLAHLVLARSAELRGDQRTARQARHRGHRLLAQGSGA